MTRDVFDMKEIEQFKIDVPFQNEISLHKKKSSEKREPFVKKRHYPVNNLMSQGCHRDITRDVRI